MSLSFKQQITKTNFVAMLNKEYDIVRTDKHGPTTLFYAKVPEHLLKENLGMNDRHVASWETGTGWIFTGSSDYKKKSEVGHKILEDLKLFMRGNHVDVTSINTHTVKHMEDNPELCFEIQMFEPNDLDQPEVKTRMWAYPDKHTVWVEAPSLSNTEWPGLKTAIYHELRTHGFVDSSMNDWKVEIC